MTDPARNPPALEGLFIAEREGYWELRLQPTDSFRQVMEQMEEVRAFCVAKKPFRMLLDMRTVLAPLTVADRYEMGSFASRVQGLVGRVVVLLRSELIDPQKFGVRVAQNRGVNVDVFPDSDAALRWLLHP